VSLFESILTGLDEARRHLGQTALALLGIILGTGSIVTVLALFGGQAAHTQQYLDEVGGAGTLIVSNRDLPLQPSARQLRSERLTYRDAQLLKARADRLSAVSPGWVSNLTYTSGTRTFEGQVIGTVPDYARINRITPLVGRYLTEFDVSRGARVAVMGWKYADSLFGKAEAALGRNLLLGGKQFTVVGVMTREEFYFASWEDNALEYRNERAYIPISTAVDQFTGTDPLDFLTLKAESGGPMDQAQAQVQRLLYSRHGVEDFDIRPSGAGAGGESGQFLLLFNFIFLIVGVVSLFTGGIVIANIMLASVVERVREFGTRMALGATTGGVFAHVLTEALLVTLMGGLLGLGLGTALTGTVAKIMALPAYVSPTIAMLSITTSIVVGLIAGMYPAIRASRLSPVEALRYG
jgi:putative ABC transport system permease protein